MSLMPGASLEGCLMVLRARRPDFLLPPGSRGRPRPPRRDRHRHDRVPHRRPTGLLGQMVTPGHPVRRQAQGQQRRRPRQPLPERRPRRSRERSRPHPVVFRRPVPADGPADAEEESPGRDRELDAHHHPRPAVRPRSQLPGPRRGLLPAAHARRQARNHIRNLERLGYKVTFQALRQEAGQPSTEQHVWRATPRERRGDLLGGEPGPGPGRPGRAAV